METHLNELHFKTSVQQTCLLPLFEHLTFFLRNLLGIFCGFPTHLHCFFLLHDVAEAFGEQT